MCAVFPSALEPVQETLTVGRKLEPVLCHGRSCDVPAQPLEPATISTIDRLARVDVDATNIGERLARCRDLADRMHELASPLAGRGTQQLAITD